MAGSFPGLPLAQQFDINGNPLGGALLYVFAGGSTTPVSVFQDIGLTVPAQWPLEADASGRLPLFFVNDGNYHLRLTDTTGVVVLDAPNVPSIGPSSTGSSGGAVDPTTVFSTGDVKWQAIQGTIAGWVRCNRRTIGSATSGASEFAGASAQSLFIYLWTNFDDTACPVVGGRGASALADWNANKQITLLNFRGFVLGGVSDMGNTDNGEWASAPVIRGNGTTAGSLLGENTHTMLVTEMPVHNHTANLTLPSAALSGAPSLTLPGATLNLPGATLNLPGASFSGNTMTPSFTGTPATINVTCPNPINFGNSAGDFTTVGGTGVVRVGNAFTANLASSGNYTPAGTISPVTPTGSVNLTGGSVTLSGGSVTLSGGSVGLGSMAVGLSGGSVATLNTGGGAPHNNCQLTALGTFYMKL